MKYSAIFIKEIRKKDNGLLLLLQQCMPEGERASIVLVSNNKKEQRLPASDVKGNGKELFISISSLVNTDFCNPGKWEVYVQTGDMRYRLEHIKNKGRKRFSGGRKVKPYAERKGVYDASDQVRDALSISNSEYVVLPRYTRDWQLLVQVLPKKDTYLYRYFFQMKELKIENDKLVLTLGKEQFGFIVSHVKMTLRGTDKSYLLARGEKNQYEISLKDIEWEPFFWDFSVIAEKNGILYECKLRNYKKGFTGSVRKRLGDFYLFSYYTQNDNIVLHYRPYSEYDEELYRKREKKAVWLYHLFKPFWDAKGIVLMYEKFCKCAQDNAFAMFEYYMGKKGRDKRRTYYIIDSREPDAAGLLPYKKHVIEFMSLRHMIYLQAAKLLVSTDTIKHAYQWRGVNTKIYDKLLTKHSVFLQHGVLALKRVEYIYNKNGGNKTDLFISSSLMEQKIITENFRYAKQEVPVTGLARWDRLENQNTEPVILVMPTWRNWIIEVDEKQFVQTDYYKNYRELLNSDKLEKLLETYDAKMIFCMHPKFREFMGQFDTAGKRIELFDYETRPIRELVMEASMMVTDYSSVSWDMYYMEKPIVFYQFDYERYMEEQGSYIDMTKELYGDRATSPEELLSLLEEYMKNGFTEKTKYADLRQTYLPCRDGLHCKRIDEAIKNHCFTRFQTISRKILRT